MRCVEGSEEKRTINCDSPWKYLCRHQTDRHKIPQMLRKTKTYTKSQQTPGNSLLSLPNHTQSFVWALNSSPSQLHLHLQGTVILYPCRSDCSERPKPVHASPWSQWSVQRWPIRVTHRNFFSIIVGGDAFSSCGCTRWGVQFWLLLATILESQPDEEFDMWRRAEQEKHWDPRVSSVQNVLSFFVTVQVGFVVFATWSISSETSCLLFSLDSRDTISLK